MFFSLIFIIDEDFIKIYYHKDVEFLNQNLVDVALECGQYGGQSKKYYLVLKMAITGHEGRFLFIFFSNLHSMISISQVKLNKISSST